MRLLLRTEPGAIGWFVVPFGTGRTLQRILVIAPELPWIAVDVARIAPPATRWIDTSNPRFVSARPCVVADTDGESRGDCQRVVASSAH